MSVDLANLCQLISLRINNYALGLPGVFYICDKIAFTIPLTGVAKMQLFGVAYGGYGVFFV